MNAPAFSARLAAACDAFLAVPTEGFRGTQTACARVVALFRPGGLYNGLFHTVMALSPAESQQLGATPAERYETLDTALARWLEGACAKPYVSHPDDLGMVLADTDWPREFHGLMAMRFFGSEPTSRKLAHMIENCAGTVFEVRDCEEPLFKALKAREKTIDQSSDSFTEVMEQYRQVHGLAGDIAKALDAVLTRGPITGPHYFDGLTDDGMETDADWMFAHAADQMVTEADLLLAAARELRETVPKLLTWGASV
jgi:hypothetical protein